MKPLGKAIMACALGIGLALSASNFTPGTAEAYYADTTSAVSKGSDGTWHYAAINVVDDDSTVTLKAWKSSAGEERVNYVKTTANNGFATPAGLTVGMSKSTMQGLYGVEDPYYDKKTGYTEYMYPHMGSGAGAGMRILVDDDNTIRSIEVLD